MANQTDPTPDAVRGQIEALREAYSWLALLVEPGRERRPGRPVDDAQAERLEAQGRADRAYRQWNISRGLSALPPSPAAASVTVVDAQASVRRRVLDIAHRVAAWQHASWVGGPDVDQVLSWLDEAGPGRPAVVDELRDRRRLSWLVDELATAVASARQAAGVVAEPVRPVAWRCPACGSPSLQLAHPGADKSLWTISCVRRACRCAGAGCGCLRRDRRQGLAHVWTRAELPTLAQAVAIADRVARQGRPVTGSAAAGHGGWSDRRTVR
ncbi:hypothetical protein [Solwaraspora sp. WMMD792]|uniref:hypothetical protein n=1 Tax=Solwaraspora sp. WMMD792 TaxID=3016099 RepID=UPI0024175C80|nr:hypothetical protein [Solwaraspora sp. WMMD792]MDG4768761.1 hypothetical protein [Solwaraspora sp. WMMD792]MDG4768800.1 hypothetical protein [Solwaraspora sp. WMMD792]MDG4768840.1 hypothetical protein [Solwaraspora sp. WMMD792]MDG4768844.1 hypothetical protein [Solwaraspora sp. WMMD792]MDG4768905.1 hypothetical protein [Solwaraspora sp. WMMD792]